MALISTHQRSCVNGGCNWGLFTPFHATIILWVLRYVCVYVVNNCNFLDQAGIGQFPVSDWSKPDHFGMYYRMIKDRLWKIANKGPLNQHTLCPTSLRFALYHMLIYLIFSCNFAHMPDALKTYQFLCNSRERINSFVHGLVYSYMLQLYMDSELVRAF